ncbi:MAG: response regulator [Ignavibacteria bacterium]|nr:response regulator [Ignavibacteria bacterium]
MPIAKIFIVEDEAITALDIKNTLEKLKYEVVGICNRGDTAVKEIRKAKPDLVLMDIFLKGEIDGIETARLLNVAGKLPVIYLSARTDDETIDRSRSTNPYGYLLKPLNDRDLNSCIKSAIYRIESEKRVDEAEELLKDSRRMNIALLNSIPSTAFLVNQTGLVTAVNNHAKIENFPTSHFLNKKIQNHFPGNTGIKFNALIKETFETGLEQKLEHYINLGSEKLKYETRFIRCSKNDLLVLFKNLSSSKNYESELKKSEDKYKNLVQNSPFAITRLIIKNNRYEFVNDEFVKQSGYTLDEFNSLSNEEYLNMMHPDDRKMVNKEYSKWLNNGCKGVKTLTYRIYNKNKNLIWLDSFHYADVNTDGSIEAVNQIYLNISKQKENEEYLLESKQYLDAFFQQSLDGIFIAKLNPPVLWNNNNTDENLDNIIKNIKIIRSNSPLAVQFGVNSDEVVNIATERYFKGNMDEARKRWRYFLKNGHSHTKEYYQRNDGSRIFIEGDYFCLYNSNGLFSGYMGIQRDITEKHSADELIKKSEEKYRNFVKHSSEGIFRLEFSQKISVNLPVDKQVELIIKYVHIAECNTVFAKMYDENDPANLTGKPVFNLKYTNLDLKGRILKFVINDYNITEDEINEHDKDGNVKSFVINAAGVIEDGILTSIWGIQRDVSEKKRSDVALKKSLTEKEILLKEIHHRVKNNLQVVTSLLKLQAGYIKDENIKLLFKESQDRVNAMSLIHQKLYQSKDLGQINFNEYIETVTTHLQHSYGILEDRVKINTDFSNIKMSIDNAIPAGLIINELVSNALKHAFPGNMKGCINISAAYDNYSKEYWFVIRDNGIGIKNKVNNANSESFGLKLVNTLVQQLDGIIEIINLNGTEFRIHFNNADYSERNN